MVAMMHPSAVLTLRRAAVLSEQQSTLPLSPKGVDPDGTMVLP